MSGHDSPGFHRFLIQYTDETEAASEKGSCPDKPLFVSKKGIAGILTTGICALFYLVG